MISNNIKVYFRISRNTVIFDISLFVFAFLSKKCFTALKMMIKIISVTATVTRNCIKPI